MKNGGPYTLVGTSPVPSAGWDLGTSFTDAGLANGTSYYYVVSASNKTGESPASLEIEVTPSPEGSNKLKGIGIGKGEGFAAALDGDLKTCFESNDGWEGLDLGTPNIITEIRYPPP